MITEHTIKIRAVQWDGSDASWDAICELYNSKTVHRSYYLENENDTITISLRYADTRLMRPGEWLILTRLNMFEIYDDASFKKLTQP